MELPYIEYAHTEPGIKLVHEGEDYWYYRTLPLKGYGAVLAKYISLARGGGAQAAAGALRDPHLHLRDGRDADRRRQSARRLA